MASQTTDNRSKEEVFKDSLWARILIGILVPLLALALVFGLGWAVFNPLAGLKQDKTLLTQANEALIMFFAGGVGSSVGTIRAYLKHACERRDFDAVYSPWYILRLLTGGLLGLIFYFALRGGLLFLTVNNAEVALESLNVWSLAAIGSLVGLFSKYALEKLREVFVILFEGETEEEKKIEAIVSALPPEQQEKFNEAWKKSSEGSDGLG